MFALCAHLEGQMYCRTLSHLGHRVTEMEIEI